MSNNGFVYFGEQGCFHAVESEEIAKFSAAGPNKKYLPLPDGFRASAGDAWANTPYDDTRIDGELAWEAPPKGQRIGTVTWDIETIQGNIRNYPVLLAVAKELLA